MLNALTGLLGSTKVLMTVAGLIVAFLAKRGFNVSDEIVLAILGFFASAVLGQGMADKGKEAAKIDAVAASARQLETLTPKASAAIEQMAAELNTPPQ